MHSSPLVDGTGLLGAHG